MAISVNKLTNANIYVDGVSYLGKAEEVMLPDIKQIMSEHKALGMVGKLELFSGIDKLEAKVKWNSFYVDVLKKMGNPLKPFAMQVRSSITSYASAGVTGQIPCVCYITGSSKNFPLGNYKQHDNVEAETNIAVTYCKMEIAGEVVMEFDVLANIFKVGGENVLADYNANLGI